MALKCMHNDCPNTATQILELMIGDDFENVPMCRYHADDHMENDKLVTWVICTDECDGNHCSCGEYDWCTHEPCDYITEWHQEEAMSNTYADWAQEAAGQIRAAAHDYCISAGNCVCVKEYDNA